MKMTGKVAVVTGASSGVGFVTARELARLSSEVVIVCRDPSRGSAALSQIARAATGPAPRLFVADISSQAAVRTVAAEIRSEFGHIDVLINNAAAMFARRELTSEGIEKTLATNHLGAFLLTNSLLDLLLQAPSGRILMVVSESHGGSLEFGNLQGERHYQFFDAYQRSKLSNILFAYELARRLQGTNVSVNCVSPRPTRSGIGDNMAGAPGLAARLIKSIPFLVRGPERNAAPLVYVACSPELEGVSGRFFLRCGERRTKPISYDVQVAARLWAVCEGLCATR